MNNDSKIRADLLSVMKAETLTSESGVPVHCRIYRPGNLACGEKVPVFLFLHGAGERGDDNIMQLLHCVPDIMDFVIGEKHPAVIMAPQCPADMKWVDVPWGEIMRGMPETPSAPLQTVIDALHTEIESPYADRSRIYVSGISMGGYGTWDLLSRFPALFAAGMPICGGCDASRAAILKNIPLRTFHGESDDAVPAQGTRNMVEALKTAGNGNVSYTEFPGAGHDVWTRVYADHANLRWLFTNSL